MSDTETESWKAVSGVLIGGRGGRLLNRSSAGRKEGAKLATSVEILQFRSNFQGRKENFGKEKSKKEMRKRQNQGMVCIP